MNFFTELKRRNVFKIASVYLLITWLILQVIAVISPTLNLPIMFGTIVTVILFIGFPIACVIAWAFELTPEGMKFTKDVAEVNSIRHETGQKLNASLMAVIVLLLSFIIYNNFFTAQLNDTIEVSIAVLPFQDMSPDKSQEYFGDGIAEEILNSLARLNKMLVIARTSSFKFKNENDDIRKIGKLLNVNYILEGSVRKEKETFRITAQLIDVQSGSHLWSQTYDRAHDSIFAIQDELTFAITQALKLNLLPKQVQAEKGITSNQQAYDYFLKGRSLGYQRNQKDLLQAKLFLEKSITLDPEFHLAKAQLYIVFQLIKEYGGLSTKSIGMASEKLFYELVATDVQFPLKTLVKATYFSDYKLLHELSTPLFEQARKQAPNNSVIHSFSLADPVYITSVESALSIREQFSKVNPLDETNLYNLANLYFWLNKKEEAYNVVSQMNNISENHSLTAETNLMLFYRDKFSPNAALAYLDNFNGELTNFTEVMRINLMAYTGEIEPALALLNESPVSYEEYKESYALLYHKINTSTNLSKNKLALEQLKLNAEQADELNLRLNLWQGNTAQLLNHPDYQFNSVKEVIKALEEKQLEFIFEYALIRKSNNSLTFENEDTSTIEEDKEACIETKGKLHIYCPAILYLTSDISLDELFKLTQKSLSFLDPIIGIENFILTSPYWRFLHEHPEFSRFANEFLNKTYRKWESRSN